VVEAAEGYDGVLNGRFKGGWTTRHYGRPDTGVHAIQMELSQSTHLQTETAPFAYDDGECRLLDRAVASLAHIGADT
ncbi:N-formylglutamate amidohydrolase, partial [Rhizobium leguminosarum]|uniref:N-formylglutamate amidohydrolase n=1 Tax=Rhizobium leguminosarum TaxID=384 RepID=UPI003F9943AA